MSVLSLDNAILMLIYITD